MAIDYKSIIIPHQLSHLMKINGDYLLVSAFASAREMECCRVNVAHTSGCVRCGKQYFRIGCVTPSQPFNRDWYYAYIEFAGVFKTCYCDESRRLNSISNFASTERILSADNQRILNGYISEDEANWRLQNGLLSEDEINRIKEKGFLEGVEIRNLSDLEKKMDKRLTPGELPF